MEIGKIYIITTILNPTLSLDKFISMNENSVVSNYVVYNDTKNTYKYCQNISYGKWIIEEYIPLDEYLENPNEHPNIDYDIIIKMYKKFMENDIVEARKYKLKLLENL